MSINPEVRADENSFSNTRRSLNEMRRLESDQGAPERGIPEHLTKHYDKDGNAYRSHYRPEKIEFVDRGNRMHAYLPISTFTVRAMAEIAEARGWKDLEVTGNQKFQQSLYIEATSRGIGVQGYQATDKDVEILQRRAERKEAGTNPLVQAFMGADSKKARDEAVKQYPQLKEAFAAEAAAQRVAEEKIDSKKAAQNFVGRFRDSIAIALHTGRELPKVELRVDHQQDRGQAQIRHQDRLR